MNIDKLDNLYENYKDALIKHSEDKELILKTKYELLNEIIGDNILNDLIDDGKYDYIMVPLEKIQKI